jgi:hypothetical protein
VNKGKICFVITSGAKQSYLEEIASSLGYSQ